MEQNTFYILEHVYEVNDIEEIKFIGLFTTTLLAEEAIELLKNKPGFVNHPVECFQIGRVILNNVGWQDGFVNWAGANEKIK